MDKLVYGLPRCHETLITQTITRTEFLSLLTNNVPVYIKIDGKERYIFFQQAKDNDIRVELLDDAVKGGYFGMTTIDELFKDKEEILVKKLYNHAISPLLRISKWIKVLHG